MSIMNETMRENKTMQNLYRLGSDMKQIPFFLVHCSFQVSFPSLFAVTDHTSLEHSHFVFFVICSVHFPPIFNDSDPQYKWSHEAFYLVLTMAAAFFQHLIRTVSTIIGVKEQQGKRKLYFSVEALSCSFSFFPSRIYLFTFSFFSLSYFAFFDDRI